MNDLDLYPYLLCHCHNKIQLPLSTHTEKVPSQTPWPQDGNLQTFWCPVCKRAYAYSIDNVLFRSVPSQVALQSIHDSAVFQFSLSCADDKCAGLVEVHAVLSKDSEKSYASNLVSKFFLWQTPCNTANHKHEGWSRETDLVDLKLDPDWAVLA
jgi:hypothetical protein